MDRVLITMAGESRRFRDAGFTVPKYRLSVRGRTLFSWSLSSLERFLAAGWRPCFVGRATDVDLSMFIEQELSAFGGVPFDLIQLDASTDGQASTASMATSVIADDDRVAIYNIDTYVDPAALDPADVRGDGWVPCFPGEGDGWSFLALDDEARVSEVREKVRISDHCTIGLYAFRTFALFLDAHRSGAEAKGAAEHAERYIAPLYNTIINDGGTVYGHCIDARAVHPLGTPVEVEAFSKEGADG